MAGIARVLIVDDNSEVREALRLTLKDNYNVAVACDAEAAFRHMASCPVDIVLLDVRMPNTDGLTALGEIKRRHPDAEVIMMTGYAPVDTMQKASCAGAFAFFMKPFDIKKLMTAIDNALEKNASRRD